MRCKMDPDVKNLSRIDNDLPIINKAMREYMINRTDPEKIINTCDDLIMFQKIVKLSSKYDYVKHNNRPYSYKCYRVFASKSSRDGMIYKCKNDGNPEKFANTPDKCFIENGNIVNEKIPANLDKRWYIELTKERLRQYGAEV